jgi:SpoVK/Ycf46/Vps4 family AAA+-type ATPase
MTKNVTPSNINNYNKFLIELDKNSNPNHSFDVCINGDIVEELDKIDFIVHNINDKYDNELLLTSALLTGSIREDNDIIKSEKNNPNLYQDETYPSGHKRVSKSRLPEEKCEEMKCEEMNCEEIKIDVEIQNIDDILKLIEMYPYDSAIKYNIDMKSLHNIKEPLQEINNMIGMKELKMSITGQLIYFIQKLHINADATGDFMHTVIYGPPGTGKTEVAKLMGKIYSKLGVLSGGTFLKVTRSDLIAGYLGQTAIKTADVIKKALGGVLFIDEAYALGNSDKKDSFSKECIDTLCEALSDHKNNLMVIIAGYETELKDCFFNYNAGLESRFTWRFKTEEYTGKDLHAIFKKKVADIGWTIHAKNDISHEWFDKNRESFQYFGRDIESFLAKTKISHSKRVFCKPITEKKCLTKEDLMKGFDVYLHNSDNKHKKEDKYFKNHLQSTLYS